MSMHRTLFRLVMAMLPIVVASCGPEDSGLGSSSEAAIHPRVGVTHATVKVRDDFPVPTTAAIQLDAAQNEYEPFQIVIRGGDAIPVDNLKVTKAALSHTTSSGTTLDAKHIRLFQVGRYFIKYASSKEGGSGWWPDPLIPDVDAYDNQARNAFADFDVPAAQSRAVWVDVFVPPGQPPGLYTGTLTVSGTNLPLTAVTINLRVRGFELPSTATLKSLFKLQPDEVTRAHYGGQWCSDHSTEKTNGLLMKYARAALNHRITLSDPYCGHPSSSDPSAWTTFDAWQGKILDGSAATELGGAQVTTWMNPDGSPHSSAKFVKDSESIGARRVQPA